MILSKLKSYILIFTTSSLLGASGYIYYQSHKIKQANSDILQLENDLDKAHDAFESQQAVYNRVRHELIATQKANAKYQESLRELEDRHRNLEQSLVELRKRDNEVNEYLNTDIPTNLLEWLYKRSN